MEAAVLVVVEVVLEEAGVAVHPLAVLEVVLPLAPMSQVCFYFLERTFLFR